MSGWRSFPPMTDEICKRRWKSATQSSSDVRDKSNNHSNHSNHSNNDSKRVTDDPTEKKKEESSRSLWCRRSLSQGFSTLSDSRQWLQDTHKTLRSTCFFPSSEAWAWLLSFLFFPFRGFGFWRSHFSFFSPLQQAEPLSQRGFARRHAQHATGRRTRRPPPASASSIQHHLIQVFHPEHSATSNMQPL